jgi:hypothetical protein
MYAVNINKQYTIRDNKQGKIRPFLEKESRLAKKFE